MSDEPREPMPPRALPPVTRRSFLFKLGLGLNALAAALVAVPLIGYVISAVVQTRADQAWIPLGSIGDFPERETRLATYRNPFQVAWDGTTADIPCWVRRVGGERFQVFAIAAMPTNGRLEATLPLPAGFTGTPVWFPGLRLAGPGDGRLTRTAAYVLP